MNWGVPTAYGQPESAHSDGGWQSAVHCCRGSANPRTGLFVEATPVLLHRTSWSVWRMVVVEFNRVLDSLVT